MSHIEFLYHIIWRPYCSEPAREEHITIAEARQKLVSSEAYDALYDQKTELWQEGPDYFRYFYKQLKN